MVQAGIYKLTSPSGKIYIGQSINLYKRINKYKNKDCKKQIALQSSICKYGFENFKVDILWSTTDDTNIAVILNELERDFIYLYDCLSPNGYNLIEGGSQRILSEEGILNHRNAYLKRSRHILQYSTKGVFIKEWLCISDITNELKLHKSNIHNVCTNKRKTSNGFIWKYKKEDSIC